MCQRVHCARCGRPTWIGCGRHVAQALAGVAVSERCECPRSRLSRLLGWRGRPEPRQGGSGSRRAESGGG